MEEANYDVKILIIDTREWRNYMPTITVMTFIALLTLILLLLFFILIKISRLKKDDTKAQLAILESTIDRLERGLKDELGKNRAEFGLSSKALREEVSNSLKGFTDSIGKQMIGSSQLRVMHTRLTGSSVLLVKCCTLYSSVNFLPSSGVTYS